MRSVLSSARPRYLVAYAALLSGGLVFAAPAIASAACVPGGAILVGWDDLGAASGPLGNCVNNEGNDGAGGKIEQFQFGWIDWMSPERAGYGVYGLIGAAWMSRYGGPTGFLGQAFSNEYEACAPACGGGRESNFINVAEGRTLSYLVWNPGTAGPACDLNSDNVCAVHGEIAERWVEVISVEGQIGFPTDEEYDDGTGHRLQHFQNMYITWNESNGNACAFWLDGTEFSGSGPC